MVDENYVENLQTSMVPYVVGQIFGCDVVMDDDQALEQAQSSNLNGDDLENFDMAPNLGHNDMDIDLQVDAVNNNQNYFATLGQLEEGEIQAIAEEALNRSIGKTVKMNQNNTSNTTSDLFSGLGQLDIIFHLC